MRFSGLLFLLFSAAATWAQLPSQGPQAVYEGQAVSAVDLIANPHRDVEPLRPFVAQKAGQAYSQTSVQASIAALEKNGGFNKVGVNVIPDPSGLRLNFILESPYYFGMIEFPGVDKYFPYTRLLQVVNLPDEDPYDKARIPGAKAEFLNFLQKNGYFQAQVRAEPQIDDTNQLVNISFSTQLGKQARIGKVEMRAPPTLRTPACFMRRVHSAPDSPEHS